MERGWLVNSILSRSKEPAAALPGRSYQISPIAPPSWRALLQGRKSRIPQGFGRAHVRASSIVITPRIFDREKRYSNVVRHRNLEPSAGWLHELVWREYGDAEVAGARQGEGG